MIIEPVALEGLATKLLSDPVAQWLGHVGLQSLGACLEKIDIITFRGLLRVLSDRALVNQFLLPNLGYGATIELVEAARTWLNLVGRAVKK